VALGAGFNPFTWIRSAAGSNSGFPNFGVMSQTFFSVGVIPYFTLIFIASPFLRFATLSSYYNHNSMSIDFAKKVCKKGPQQGWTYGIFYNIITL
jgi:hypothetical protein